MKNQYHIFGNEVWIELNRPKEKRTLFTVIDLVDLPLMDKIPGRLGAAWSIKPKCFYAKYDLMLGGRQKTTKLLHQLLFNFPKNKQIDHKNHDGLNNRRNNIRIVSQRENIQNLKSKTSKFPGVSWANHANKWRARIKINKSYKHLGYFEFETDAASAYRDACIENNLPILPEVLNI
jgi:hypothetical protein